MKNRKTREMESSENVKTCEIDVTVEIEKLKK